MRREDIYRQMEREGNYSEAREYKETCERNGHSMDERVSRWNSDDIRDGAGYSRAGDEAVRAADEIRRDEIREQEREEQQEQERQNQVRQRQRERDQEEQDNMSEE